MVFHLLMVYTHDFPMFSLVMFQSPAEGGAPAPALPWNCSPWDGLRSLICLEVLWRSGRNGAVAQWVEMSRRRGPEMLKNYLW